MSLLIGKILIVCHLYHCIECPLNIIIFIIVILGNERVLLIVINIIHVFYYYRVGLLTRFIDQTRVNELNLQKHFLLRLLTIFPRQ